MKALFVAYQDPESRDWTPVGRLTREAGSYNFVYTKGAAQFPTFVPFGRMHDLHSRYVSEQIFPLFSNRLLPKSRPEYSEYLNWLGLTPDSHDNLEELARTGGLRATDTLELIPCPEPTSSNQYEVFFFCRGLSHFPPEAQTRASSLALGERLFLMKDIQNQSDIFALMLRTDAPVTTVGYVPRYYSEDFSKLLSLLDGDAIKVTVERVNHSAPIQYRLLCKLTAPWPANFKPCESSEFEKIASLETV